MRLADPTGSRVILVGTATYEDPALPDLPSVAGNVRDLGDVLCDPRLGGLDPSACRAFVDMRSGRAWEIAEAAAEAEDVLLIYFAGHGLLDDDGHLLLALSDTRDAYPSFNSLQMEDLRRVLLGSRARTKLLVLDCCYSARAIERLGGLMGGPQVPVEVAGTYTLASSPANHASIAPPGARHTAFTGALISLLRTGVEEGVEFISVDAVYRELARSLPMNGFPSPKQFHSGTAAALALSRNPAFRAPEPLGPPGPPPPVAAPGSLRWLAPRRAVLDPGRDLDERVDGVEELAALAGDDPEAREELAVLASTARLPILLRVRCAAELAALGADAAAAAALDAVGRQGEGEQMLRRLRYFTGLLDDDDKWRAAMANRWAQGGSLTAALRSGGDELWGLLVAMMLTQLGLPQPTRVQAARELVGLDRARQARWVLKGLLRDNMLSELSRMEIRAALAGL